MKEFKENDWFLEKKKQVDMVLMNLLLGMKGVLARLGSFIHRILEISEIKQKGMQDVVGGIKTVMEDCGDQESQFWKCEAKYLELEFKDV